MNRWRAVARPLCLRFGPVKFQVCMAEAQREEAGLRDGMAADSVTAGPSGFLVNIPGRGRLRFEPEGWCDWWSDNMTEAEGADAAKLLADFHRWHLDKVAREALQAIEAGQLAFQDLAERAPELARHPAIQQAVTAALFEGRLDQPRKRGRSKGSTALSPGLYELVQWVERYQRAGMTLEAACLEAVTEHPEHVPNNWGQSPADNLKKSMERLHR